MELELTRSKQSRLDQVDFEQLEFGTVLSDHMASVAYEDGQWQTLQIKPYGPIAFDPALSTLHYGQAIFEGLKAYATEDGDVQLFRLDRHFERLNQSAKRMCIPELPWDLFYESLKQVLQLDQGWVPKRDGCALYIRPFIFATDQYLGVRPSKTYQYMVITSPVGAYYKNAKIAPVRLLSSGGEFVRAVKGGVGMAKTAGNYAASLYPAKCAQEQGYTQVLWLDGQEGKYVDEVGTMNIFFVIDDQLVTPPLYGPVLSGVTRDSVLALAKKWGIKASERMISMDELFAASAEGRLSEAFGTGTAVVISPVGEIAHDGKSIQLKSDGPGPLAQRFYQEITDIQYGRIEDQEGWVSQLSKM